MVVQVKKYSGLDKVIRDSSLRVCWENGTWEEQCSSSLHVKTLWLNLFNNPFAKLLLVDISSIISIKWSDNIPSVDESFCCDMVSGLNFGGTVSVG